MASISEMESPESDIGEVRIAVGIHREIHSGDC